MKIGKTIQKDWKTEDLYLDDITFFGLDKDGDLEIAFNSDNQYTYLSKENIPKVIEYLQSLLAEKPLKNR